MSSEWLRVAGRLGLMMVIFLLTLCPLSLKARCLAGAATHAPCFSPAVPPAGSNGPLFTLAADKPWPGVYRLDVRSGHSISILTTAGFGIRSYPVEALSFSVSRFVETPHPWGDVLHLQDVWLHMSEPGTDPGELVTAGLFQGLIAEWMKKSLTLTAPDTATVETDAAPQKADRSASAPLPASLFLLAGGLVGGGLVRCRARGASRRTLPAATQ